MDFSEESHDIEQHCHCEPVCALARNDWEFGPTMTGNSIARQITIDLFVSKINMHLINNPGAICAPGSHILRQIQPVGDQIVSREVAHGTDCKPSEGSNHQSHRIAHGFQIYAKGQAC